jgi:hypothetical protein
MRCHLLLSLIGFCLAAAAGAAEEPRTTVGVLTCTLKETTQNSPENIMCGFKSDGSTIADEKYNGTVQGPALAAVGKQVLIWTVVAPAKMKLVAGFLTQGYIKAKVPGHPPEWVGEQNPMITLQFETHESAELGSGIARIDLKLEGTSA